MRFLTHTTVAAVVFTACVVVGACGAPEDPAIPPPPPGDDAGPGVDSSVAITNCAGVANGTACAGGKICANGICSTPACGDGVVTAPEECDLGTANAVGGGCEPSCKLTCTTTDAARNCVSANACVANGVCDPVKHTCSVGAPLAPGSTCGTYKLCVDGDCVAGTCGDAITTTPEQCDNGTSNGPGKGCESTCKFSCSNAATDCAPAPCNILSCGATHLCQQTPDVAKNGQACGVTAGYTCSNGACVAPGAVCGNGVKEGGEDCDFGVAGNGANTGCEANCKFSCTAVPLSCTDMNACHNTPTCDAIAGPAGGSGFKCNTGTTKADGAVCGVGSICLASVCKASTCGDGYRDPAKSEDCDDGNTTKLDACDDKCKFEQDARVVAMTMLFDTSMCATNALGGAVKGPAQGNMNTNITAGIKDGSLTALFKVIGPNLTGANAAITVGSMSGIVVAGAAYNGESDLEWWYHPDPLTIDGARNATATLAGNYAGGVLDATGRLNLSMNIAGSGALFKVSSAHLVAPIGAVNTPLVSAAGATPGHIATEHLNAALQSYATMGGTKAAQTGMMCGDISAASFATTNVPATLLSGLLTKCKENYTANNRMLDVFIGGCINSLAGTFIVPTQPDHVDPAAAVGGAGGPYTLALDAVTKRVTTCKDKNGAAVAQLQTCLDAAAYSSSFKFATDRVIIK